MKSRGVGCALLVAMVLAGGGASAQQSPAGNSPAATSPASKPAAGKPAAPGSGAVRQPDHRTVRARIALLVELLAGYRPIEDDRAPRLVNAQIAGPIADALPLQGSGEVYCVRADIDPKFSGILLGTKTTRVTVEARPNGTMSVRARSVAGAFCTGTYGPFPELEQQRAKRRKAMGKPA
jgi:hypothetical protein